MKQVVVGQYRLGYECVQLVLREGSGGEFYTVPEEGRIARIKVGADFHDWARVVEVLLHEAMELAMVRIGCRYAPAPDAAQDNGGYMFVMTHTQFAEAGARTGEYMSAALPDLAKAWAKWRKNK